jgi:hypothetical protein
MALAQPGELIPRLIAESDVRIVRSLISIAAALAAILVVQSVNGEQAAGLDRLLAAPPWIPVPDAAGRILNL